MRVQDTEISGRKDEEVLAWTANEGRILLTHDVNTMLDEAYARVKIGLPMPGVIAVIKNTPISRVIEDILLIVECSEQEEWDSHIRFLPI